MDIDWSIFNVLHKIILGYISKSQGYINEHLCYRDLCTLPIFSSPAEGAHLTFA